MNIWSKMIAALKGDDDEHSESRADARAIRLLDDEVRSASIALSEARDALAELMAKQKLADEQVNDWQQKITEHEDYARQALAQNNEALALEVAEKIVEFEAQQQDAVDERAVYARHVKDAQQILRQTERSVTRLKQQLDTIKATQSVQRAQAAISQRSAGSGKRIQTAQDSLERLRQRQAHKAAQFDVDNNLNVSPEKDDLLAKLEQAGIKTNGTQIDRVFDRLQAKKK